MAIIDGKIVTDPADYYERKIADTKGKLATAKAERDALQDQVNVIESDRNIREALKKTGVSDEIINEVMKPDFNFSDYIRDLQRNKKG
jgi:SOS response regulatory protein OraA/RecX